MQVWLMSLVPLEYLERENGTLTLHCCLLFAISRDSCVGIWVGISRYRFTLCCLTNYANGDYFNAFHLLHWPQQTLTKLLALYYATQCLLFTFTWYLSLWSQSLHHNPFVVLFEISLAHGMHCTGFSLIPKSGAN